MPTLNRTLPAFARIQAPLSRRNRHDRTEDHTGNQPLSSLVLEAAVGRYPAGSRVTDVLADMLARIAGRRPVYSFTANASITGTRQRVRVAAATIRRPVADSFSADASIT